MIWIYAAQGWVGQALVSFLTRQLPSAKLFLVQATGESDQATSSEAGISWLQHHANQVEFCLFLGYEKSIWNENSSADLSAAFKQIWRQCVQHDIPLLYFSSYETYLPQTTGPWNDHDLTLADLTPVTPFGQACHTLDAWVNQQHKRPYYWAGLKLAEVYQLVDGRIHFPYPATLPTAHYDYLPLIYLEDALQVIWYFMRSRKVSGFFNVTSAEYVVSATCARQPEIRRMDSFFSMNDQKLRNLGLPIRFMSARSQVVEAHEKILAQN